MSGKGIVRTLIIAFFVFFVSASFLQSQNRSEKPRLCVLITVSGGSQFVDTAKNLYSHLKRRIEQNGKHVFVSLADIKRQIPDIFNYASTSEILRQKLMEKLQINVLMTVDITGRSPLGYKLSYFIQNLNNMRNRSQGNMSFADYDSAAFTVVQMLNRIGVISGIPHFIPFPRQNAIQDSGPVWKVCVVPFSYKNSELAPEAREFNEKIIEELQQLGFIKIIPFTGIKNYLPGLKDAGQFKFPMHEIFYKKLAVDFIVYGEMEKGRPPHTQMVNMKTTIMVAHSGVIHQTKMLNYMEAHYRSILRDFRVAKSSIYQMNRPQQNETKNPSLALWEKELSGIKRRSSFGSSGSSEAGTIIEEQNEGDSYFHYLHLPANYSTTGNTYPLVVFLHGAGQRSRTLSPIILTTSPLAPLYGIRNGRPILDRSRLKNLNSYIKGSFVLTPQIHEEQFTNDKLAKLLIKIIKKYPVDTSRIYVMGVSLGGLGVWRFGNTFHSKLAALVPMCGSNLFIWSVWDGITRYNRPPEIKNIPIWAFHAWDDNILSPVHTFLAISAIIPGKLIPGDRNVLLGYPSQFNNPRLPAATDCTISYYNNDLGPWERGVVYPKGNIAFTLYRTGKHNVWDPTYANPVFWKWLFNQRRETGN